MQIPQRFRLGMTVNRPRKFGRARFAGFKQKAVDLVLGVAYAGGWPAVVTNALGMQGTLEVCEHTFRIRRRRRDAPPIRLAFASDFHAGPTLHPRLLREATDALADANADLLLLGGDFVSFHAKYADRLVEHFRRIPAPLGKFAVLGNHDLLGDDAYIVETLQRAGVTVLVNENRRLGAPHDDVWVCGLDDWNEGSPDAEKTFHGAGGTRLLLMHQPDGLLVTGDERFDAAFCGHVHGGQYLKNNRAAVIHHKGPLSTRYIYGGLFDIGPQRAPVLISRGIGTSTLPARRHADPQVHICTLVTT